MTSEGSVSVIVPCWNGRQWLPELLDSVAAQTVAPGEVIVVDNGSTDGSLQYLRSHHPDVVVIDLGRNTGFAHAVNHGFAAATGSYVALLNTDIVLATDWIARMTAALDAAPGAAAAACKMLQLDQPDRVYDAGDVLRRDGACEQRGRFGRDDGRWDAEGEVFGACAGAALYRRSAVTAVGGFDERYFAYIEDVDLSLRLRLAGWGCRYVPVVAWHAGEGSSHQLSGAHHYYVERNTLMLVGTFFPLRWLPLVAYRQTSWLRSAARGGFLGPHLRGAASGLALMWRGRERRRALRHQPQRPIEEVVPSMPIRGPGALGHRRHTEASSAPSPSHR